MKKSPVIKLFFSALRHSPVSALLTLVFSVAAALFELLPPLALEKIVNLLVDAKPDSANELLPLAFLWFAYSSFSWLGQGARDVFITILGQRVTKFIRREMNKKLYRLPADYFVTSEPGVTVSRIIGDVGTLETLFESGIIGMFSDVLSLIGICTVVYVKAPGVFWLLLPSLPLVFALTMFFRHVTKQAQSKNREAIGRSNGIIPETLRIMRTIRTLGTRRFMCSRYKKTLRDSFDATEKTNFCDAVYSPIVTLLSGILVGLTVLLAAKEGAGGTLFSMTAGTASAMIAYFGKVFGPIESIGMEIQSIQSAGAGIRRINDFLSTEERRLPPDETARTDDTAESVIEVRNLDFGYTGKNRIFNGFSLDVKKGESVTLVGRTGAGKSTLFKLLMGLYEPLGGSIKVSGSTPTDVSDKDRRKLYGYVEQSFSIVPGTVGDQITLGDERITRDAIESSLKTVGLLETIQSFEKGLDTPMSPALFSQGQLQLLSIARATVMNPEVLLLDEITANLDSATESAVIDALGRASGGKTVISISHRLYEVRKRGRIIEIS